MFNELTEENFELFAVKNYRNRHCQTIEEFREDLARFKYIKKLLYRYFKNNDLKERLILNHIIVIYNSFELKAANKMIFFQMEEKYWPQIKTFLIFLNYLKEDDMINVPLDFTIVERLRAI